MVSHPGIGVALISWEHTRILEIAQNIPGVANPEAIPQMLLAGDSETPFPPG
ncbi:MAG TPA: hypothetical protein VGF47_00070 [Solirubrobacteraceae bacterium]